MIIAFTGFMGVGKSTIAERLSKTLLCKYIDLDKYIEEKSGLSIAEIFENLGEDYFRKLEEESLEEVIANNTGKYTVLSLGGGALISSQNQKVVKETTFCIYLRGNSATLTYRLIKAKKSRPHIKEKSGEDLEKEISRLFSVREQGYKYSATLIIDVDGKSIREIVEEIIEQI